MADRPEIGSTPNYFPWATDNLTETVIEDGETLLLSNKEPPLEEHTSYGLKYDEPPNFPELNYLFSGYSEWFQFFDERYSAGDIHYTTSSEDAGQISTRLGGSWTALGSEVVGSDTVYSFKKIS